MKKLIRLPVPLLAAVLIISQTSFDLGASTAESSTVALIQDKLLTPLANKEQDRAKFSRARPIAKTRRVHMVESSPQVDARGHSFFSFSIDERFGSAQDKDVPESDWSKDAIIGCVYPETKEVFVRRKEAYYDASVLLGAKVSSASNEVCQTKK